MSSNCAADAAWASQNGLAGAMVWFGQVSNASSCLTAIAPYVR